MRALQDYYEAQDAMAADVDDSDMGDEHIVVSSSMVLDDDIPIAIAEEDAEEMAYRAAIMDEDIDEPYIDPADRYAPTSAPQIPQWAYDYDHDEELARREDPNNVEYLGAIPLLQLIGYWAALILVALSIAGEKMPWLTTHLTLPMVLIGGWYLGHVVESVNWKQLKGSGWALLFVVLPVFFIAFAQMILPFVSGSALPFQGSSQQLGELSNTSRWLAAFLGVAITGYFVVQMSFEVGWDNARRLFYSAGGDGAGTVNHAGCVLLLIRKL